MKRCAIFFHKAASSVFKVSSFNDSQYISILRYSLPPSLPYGGANLKLDRARPKLKLLFESVFVFHIAHTKIKVATPRHNARIS